MERSGDVQDMKLERASCVTVSIFGKLDFWWPHLSSPSGAALAGNQLLFTGEQFSL